MVQKTQMPEEGTLWTEIADTPSTAIVLELMETLDRDMGQFPPLAESIDPDAIDRLVSSGDPGTSLSFVHAGCTVTVTPSTISVAAVERPVQA